MIMNTISYPMLVLLVWWFIPLKHYISHEAAGRMRYGMLRGDKSPHQQNLHGITILSYHLKSLSGFYDFICYFLIFSYFSLPQLRFISCTIVEIQLFPKKRIYFNNYTRSQWYRLFEQKISHYHLSVCLQAKHCRLQNICPDKAWLW